MTRTASDPGRSRRGAAAIVGRRRLLLAGILLASAVVIGRAFQLQVLQQSRWRARAEEQQFEQLALPAPRGAIYDRNGVPLAASRDAYRIALAPREIRNPDATASRLSKVLGLSPAQARRAVRSKRRWVVLPERFDAVQRYALEGLRGVYFERVQERFYPHGALARDLLGSVAADGRALGGIELELDAQLRGTAGMAVARRDARGRTMPGALATALQPVPGHDVYLTIDLEMQEIASEALGNAVEKTGARGGDLLISDVRTGDVLAAVSRRAGTSGQWAGVTEPYEPGSTMKPFFVAALLAEERATLGDSVFAEEGQYEHDGRRVSDVHAYGWLTLRHALRVSSNIAMVKMSARLDPETHYRTLRDFGFGAPTGVRYPSESAGLLRRPDRWSRYSQGSLAMGYEIGVTPLQMAMAYGALANGGVLLEPRLVREVRGRDGTAIERNAPRAVRRVLPERVARELAPVLIEVVEEGTGQAAGLGTFRVAGKTGTARRAIDGRYARGAYIASFAGYFPADDPQLAILVKLDSPQGDYYGGLTAAPVTRATLAAALATRRTPLDRRAMATPVRVASAAPAPVRLATRQAARPVRPVVVRLGAEPPRPPARPTGAIEPVIPDVTGLSVRDAARRLHAAGFRVVVKGSGAVATTLPAGGSQAPLGSLVTLAGAAAQ